MILELRRNVSAEKIVIVLGTLAQRNESTRL